MDKKYQAIILRYLFSKYGGKYGFNISYINLHPFDFQCLARIDELSHPIYKGYETFKLLNILCEGNYLREESGSYYFTDKGYQEAWKLSTPFKYFYSYHWKWFIGTVVIGIFIAIATVLSKG